eukprot:scaffold45607_cov19-Tisochrysis_lutea.AAC.2
MQRNCTLLLLLRVSTGLVLTRCLPGRPGLKNPHHGRSHPPTLRRHPPQGNQPADRCPCSLASPAQGMGTGRDTKMGARHAMCPCSLASPCKTLAQGQGPFAPSGTSRIFPEGKQQCSKGTLVSEEYTNTDVSDLGQDTMEVAQNF